jgi:predicted nucleic acid-binding protein
VIVVDASVLANALADDGADGHVARDRLRADPSLHAPHLADLEVLSVLRRRAAAGDLDERRVRLALADLRELPMTRYPHLPFAGRVWTLRSNLTPYDAAYVALAEALGCPFVTADRAFARVPGIRCQVEVLRTR